MTTKKKKTLYSNCLERNVIWLNLKSKPIKINIFDRLGNSVKIINLDVNEGTLVPPKGFIEKEA